MTTQIENLVSDSLQAMGYVFWGCEYLSERDPVLIRIYIDRDEGISLADCAQASAAIGALLDVDFSIETSYHLEVSSPGLERLLFKKAQFQRYSGTRIKVKISKQAEQTDQVVGSPLIVGELLAADDDGITLRVVDDKTRFLRYTDVKKAHLMVGAV